MKWPEIDGRPVYVTPRRFRRMEEVLRQRQPDLRVFIEDVVNEHNVNAIVRTCDAVGVMYLHYKSARPLRLTRAIARGAEQWLEYIRHENVAEALQTFRDLGLQICATAPAPDARDYRAIDYTRPTVVVLGNEAVGVSPEIVQQADVCITIPMHGMVRSLNVSVAAAVILYEAERQRAAAGLYRRHRMGMEEYRRYLKKWALREVRTANLGEG